MGGSGHQAICPILRSPRFRYCRLAAMWRLIAAAVAAIVLGCSKKPEPPAAAITLVGEGATFPAPLYERWTAKYGDYQLGVTMLAGDAEVPSPAAAPRAAADSDLRRRRELRLAASRADQAAAPGVPCRHSPRSQRTRT